jgi:putative flavoprotein involved in K+ transport
MSASEQTVCIIGGGVSGIAWADVLARLGFRATIFERGPEVGGQWLHAYPGVTLQNTHREYQLPHFPWPETPDGHPTAAQVMRQSQTFTESLESGTIHVRRVREEASGCQHVL